ncbi:hypothetical protein [Proteocatella sphenisci]|uniref:hypothetical protein n=1 Tax=Proteocatella sphenisci TaxID=181070 RepID=UPI000491B282|nr:hypothetical protein [Proteocatella sphenisci]
MDFVKDLGRKKENKKLSHIDNNNIIENYNILVEKYNEINGFSQQVVEKHNVLVEKYNKYIEDKENEKIRYEEEIRLQKNITLKIENKFSELQKHVDRLLESYENLEKESLRLEEVNTSLEKYIEIMDKTKTASVKNERGAGRKKKYNQQQIDRILELKNSGKEYTEIVDLLNLEFKDRQWGIKEVKYVFTRYKNSI